MKNILKTLSKAVFMIAIATSLALGIAPLKILFLENYFSTCQNFILDGKEVTIIDKEGDTFVFEVEPSSPPQIKTLSWGNTPAEGYASLEAKLKAEGGEETFCEEEENRLIEEALLKKSHLLSKTALVTHYCSEKKAHICGTGDGLTASGEEVRAGLVAVPPEIPLGSTIMIKTTEGWNYYIAADHGGAIKGAHIDICVPTHAEALAAGKYTAEVRYVLEGGE